MATSCLKLNNTISVNNNKYIIDESNNQYDVFYNINNNYFIKNIPKKYPLTFYIDTSDQSLLHELSNIINFETNNNDEIIIYVSKGNDISFNNGDYFRFYDESYNLINIDSNYLNSDITINNSDNFYFMSKQKYKFIAGKEYSVDSIFKIEYDGITQSLDTLDSSFIFIIDEDANNSSRKISYYDIYNKTNTESYLNILIDSSNNKYYYGDISFSIFSRYRDFSNNIFISIKSFDSTIINRDFIKYNENCDYIVKQISQYYQDLLQQNIITLNKVSKAKFNNILKFYEFNDEQYQENNSNIYQGTKYSDISNSQNKVYNFKYGIYDETYIIFNIDKNYPIAIETNNFITIDNDYVYTKFYNTIDPKIAELSEEYSKYNYYYDSLKLVVKNLETNYQDLSVNFFILDISNREIINNQYTLNNNFVYDIKCRNPDQVNNINKLLDISFILFNQKGEKFYFEDRLNVNNIFKINRFSQYIEQELSFLVYDLYGYNISDRVLINIPYINYNDVGNIENIVSYFVNDYEDISKIALRKIEIFKGPFIEINSDISYIFQNNNIYTNEIYIENNNFSNNYDLLNNINVYFFDNLQNKVQLPYEIYYKKHNTSEINKIIDYKINSISSSINYLSFYLFNNYGLTQNDISYNYYISDNILFNYVHNETDKRLEIDSNDIKFIDISDIQISSSSNLSLNNNEILDKVNIISFNENEIAFNENIYDGSTNNINSFKLQSSTNDNFILYIDKIFIDISNINNINNILYRLILVKKYDDISYNIEIKNITNDNFNLKITNNNDNNWINISGIFNKKNIFKSFDKLEETTLYNQIDIRNINNYKLYIKPLGLKDDDVIKKYISNNLSHEYNFTNLELESDISRVININIYDNTPPIISFITDNPIFSSGSSERIEYTIPLYDSDGITEKWFYIKNNIFLTNIENNFRNIPTIYYSDDRDLTIYENQLSNNDLSYDIVSSNYILNTDEYKIKLNNINGANDISINYSLIDKSNNKSNTITLYLLFKDIPILELSSNSIYYDKYDMNNDLYYIEAGIYINGNYIDVSNESLIVNYIKDSSEINDFSFNNTTINSIDISYRIFRNFSNNIRENDVDISGSLYHFGQSLNFVNPKYNITYQIKQNNDITSITRNILITDEQPPIIKFPNFDFSFIDFSNNRENINTIIDDSINFLNFDDDSFLYKDLSFSVFTRFDEFASVINSFIIQDNYYSNVDTNYKVSVKKGDIDYDFDEFIFQQLQILSKDFFPKFNKVNAKTNILSNISDISNIYIKYEFSDPLKSKTIQRKLYIIDNEKPRISFPKLLNDYIFYEENSNNYNDFSYLAIDIENNRNKQIAITELSNILFNFVITDNYSNNQYDNLHENYNITIKKTGALTELISNIKTYHDISDNIHILTDLSAIDMNYDIIYEISDNQFNSDIIKRNLKIINTKQPIIEYKDGNTDFILRYEFGDTDFSFNNLFNYYHERLLYPIELSYNLSGIENINTLLSNIVYDPSSIIYSVPDTQNGNEKVKSLNIPVYSYIPNLDISSSVIDLSVQIFNNGPVLKNTLTYSDFSFQDLSFEAGLYISDFSLINGIIFDSSFDRFYYHNYNQDISYTETNFIVTSSPTLNKEKPEVNNYILTYESTDENNVTRTFNRNISVIDSIKPNIILLDVSENNTTFINKNKVYIESGARIFDLGSELNVIDVGIYYYGSNTLIRSKSFNLFQDNVKEYNLYDDSILLTENETSSSSDISYIIRYTVSDKANNVAIMDRKIDYKKIINLFEYTIVLRFYGIIDISLNDDFNSNLKILKENNSFLSDISMSFNNESGIVCESTIETNHISFLFDVYYYDFNGIKINISSNSNIINNIIYSNVGLYYVQFQSFETTNFFSVVNVLNFEIVDTKPPVLTFIENSNFSDITNLDFPVLSSKTVGLLKSNINFLNYFDNSNNFVNYFINNNGNISFNIPVININDILHGNTISLSNETLNEIYSNIYDFNVDYINISNGLSVINSSSSSLLLQEGEYKQTYKIYDKLSKNDNSLNRIINIKTFKPFINLNYRKDANNNIYKKDYHEINYTYRDLLGTALDYKSGSLDFSILNSNNYYGISDIERTFNQYRIGEQKIIYNITNRETELSSVKSRDVHVVNIKCLPKYIYSNFFDFINTNFDNDNKLGLYDGSYNFHIENNIGIRLISKDNETNKIYDNSNIIFFTSTKIIYQNDIKYYTGDITFNIINDFNRVSIEKIDIDNSNNNMFFKDIFLYSTKCEPIIFDDSINNSYYYKEINVDICMNLNRFMFDGIIYDKYYLSLGRYRFYQKSYKNFYSKLKFSIIKDGYHNSNYNFTSIRDSSYVKLFHYDKNVTSKNLSGKSDSYTDIIIDITTPNILYFYSENLKNYGGEIIIKNNIIFSNLGLALNSTVLSSDNSNIIQEVYSDKILNNSLNNTLFLSLNFDLSKNNIIQDVKNVVCLTHKNLNHNIKYYDNKIIIKNFENTLDSSNIKHDISYNYLIDNKIDNKKESNLLLFKYLISNDETELINENQNDFTEIFFKNKEIDNYIHFFKNNMLIDTNITIDYFMYKINELKYINKVELKDGEKIYEYFDNKYLLNYTPEFTNLYDNKFTFNLQIYLNKSLIEMEDEKLNYLNNYIFNKNVNSNYEIDNSNIFFNEYFITILSDIPIKQAEEEIINNKSIIFNKGNIELYDTLLDSLNTNNYLHSLYGIKLQILDLNIGYDFRIIYNTNNWSIYGNIEISDNYVFIKNNSINIETINNITSLYAFSDSNNLYKIYYSNNENNNDISNVNQKINEKINKIFYYNNWFLITRKYIYISQNIFDWNKIKNEKIEKINYFNSVSQIYDKLFIYGRGETHILYSNLDDININNIFFSKLNEINVFSSKNCNNIKEIVINDISYIFYCGYNNLRSEFCLAYSNINNLNDIKYPKLNNNNSYFIYTTNSQDVTIDNSNTIVFVGYMELYNSNPFKRYKSSIFYSTDAGLTFNPVENSINIFKYGFRIFYYNNKWIAFGANSIDTTNKMKYNFPYKDFKIAISDDGIIWEEGISSSIETNLFTLLHDIEEIKIMNNILFAFGNKNFIVNSNNGLDWQIFSNNFSNQNSLLHYCNDYSININSTNISSLTYNYIKLNNYITTEKLSISFAIKFNSSQVGDDDEIIFNSYDESNNLIKIFRSSENASNLVIQTSNGENNNHKIIINFDFDTSKFYHICILQNNYTYTKKIYINGEEQKTNIVEEYNNNTDKIIPIVLRNNNYIGNHNINTSSNTNLGFFIQYINFYKKELIEENIIRLYNSLAETLDYNTLDYNSNSNLLYDEINETLKNKIFLTIRDKDMINNENNRIIGITEQNLYHNMYIENDIFYFHKYNENTNNIQVITENTNIENTIKEKNSNKKFLLDICNNDLYNCFISNENIINNYKYKNNYLYNAFNSDDDIKYKLHLSYFIQDEYSKNDSIVKFFDIRPIYTNNVDINIDKYKNLYSEYENNYHTHFYTINLLDSIDRKFYNSSKLKKLISYENIDYNNLNFILQDISYVKHFNLYDLDSCNNIIYNKQDIYKLNYIQIFINAINMKINFAQNIYEEYNKIIINGYSNSNYNFINNLNMQNYQILFDDIDYVSNYFSLTLPNRTLNDLFALCLYNIRLLINKYNDFMQNIDFHNTSYNIIQNTYTSIINFNDVNKIITDASAIEINIDNLLNSMEIRYNNQNTIYKILSNNPIKNRNDFIILRELIYNYYEIYRDINIILYELKARINIDNLFYSNIISLLNDIPENIFIYGFIGSFYQLFIETLIKLDNLLLYFIDESNFITKYTFINNIKVEKNIYRNFKNINNDILIPELNDEFENIKTNFHFIINCIDNKFDFVSKLKIFDKINYVLNKSRIGINSFESNNITFKFDIYYNSFLYENIYLDTIILDIAKPDIIKPNIIFNNTLNIVFPRELNESNIENIVSILIQDISYIDMYTKNENFIINNISYSYKQLTNQGGLLKEIVNNTNFYLELDLTPIYDSYTNIVEIYYIIRDDANNTNIIPRTINVEQSNLIPIFKYNNFQLDDFSIKNYPLNIKSNIYLTQDIIRKYISAIDPERNFAFIQDYTSDIVNSNLQIDSLNSVGFYENAIKYKAIGFRGRERTIYRDINIEEFIDDEESEPEEFINKQCCYPKVYYKPIQHSYKLGSYSTTVSRISKVIVNNIR